MVGKKLLLTIAGVTLLAGTSYAQQRRETHTHPVIHSPGSPGPRGPTPFERKVNPTWHDFQHHESDVRVHPRRNGNSFLPMPNSWRGDVHNFDRDRWGRGEWHHERHNGRFGWWWVIGPEWRAIFDLRSRAMPPANPSRSAGSCFHLPQCVIHSCSNLSSRTTRRMVRICAVSRTTSCGRISRTCRCFTRQFAGY